MISILGDAAHRAPAPRPASTPPRRRQPWLGDTPTGAAQIHDNLAYESINKYLWTPPLGGIADRTFVSPGVVVNKWLEKPHTSGGQFVGR